MMAPICDHFLCGAFGYEKFCHAKVTLCLLLFLRLFMIVFVIITLLRSFSYLILFMSQLGFLRFETCLSFRVRIIDDCQCQVEEEKGTDENESGEEEKDEGCVSFLVHNHDIRPTLECNALKYIKKRPEDVIKVRYIIVRV